MLILTFALLAPTSEPTMVLAAENQENADISQNIEKTVQEALKDVCEDRGYGDNCAKHLLGMLWKESNNKANAMGDYSAKCRCYLALGYFQIHYRMHGVSATCATDLACSANWTLDYLEQNSYPKYVKYAVQCHNSCGNPNRYAQSALNHGERLWNNPLTITTVAEFKLAKN